MKLGSCVKPCCAIGSEVLSLMFCSIAASCLPICSIVNGQARAVARGFPMRTVYAALWCSGEGCGDRGRWSILYDMRMGKISRREAIGLTTAAILTPLEAFAQTAEKISAEIEAKIPSAEAIDTIVRDYVRESKGAGFHISELMMRILGEDRLAGIEAFEDAGGIVERMQQLRLFFVGDTGKLKTLEQAWLNAVATKRVAAEANVRLAEQIPKYVFLIDGGAGTTATLQSAQEVRTEVLRIALANDVLIKMRAALGRIPTER